ncbi:hypothetical protein [Agriterribacter humi]|jgi:hypothetical protein|uniref:hypothetical protein n=1 Tax=Agriterribacter humi TaxID=1104781 RepID=UPI0012650E0F|nr:hypothetical protein [Agriterribacter humi]
MNKLLLYIIVCLVTGLAIASCKKNKTDGPTQAVVTPLDTSTLNIPVSQGHLGLILDTRPIVKKGYKPAYLSLSINGALSSFSDDHMEVDEFTNLAILRIPKDSVSESQVTQFAKGVPATIKVYNEANELLAELQESLPVMADAVPVHIETLKPKIVPPLKIIAGTPYVIQALPADGYEGGGIWTYTYNMINGGLLGRDPLKVYENPYIGLGTGYIKTSDEAGQIFTFESAGNDSTFYIKAEGKKKQYIDVFKEQVQTFTGPPESSDNYKFILSQDEEGAITIKSHDHYPLKINKDVTLGGLRTDGITPVKFRLIPVDIIWTAQNMGITYDQPIMPPAQLDFALATTINNCGAGTISQEVGKADSRSTTITAGTEESFSIATEHSASVDMSLSMGVSADLFGVAGMERNLTLSVGYTFTYMETKTSTSRVETSTTERTEISLKRMADVPPYTSKDIYDAVQTYRNVVAYYVQKIRVSGKRDGIPLTGDEIASQLVANQFGGVVTETGDTYATITVRGKVNIENLMAAQTDAISRPCGG